MVVDKSELNNYLAVSDKLDFLIDFFKDIDTKKKNNDEKLVWDTEKGIFGTSDLNIMRSFFEKISPNKADLFVDLGSGDGRICLLASYFCRSMGIEFDRSLVNLSKQYASDLSITNVSFEQMDYEDFDFSDVTILFSYADHFFNERFIEKLKTEFKGVLYIYQGVFTPEGIKKGRTIWIGETPIISYDFS